MLISTDTSKYEKIKGLSIGWSFFVYIPFCWKRKYKYSTTLLKIVVEEGHHKLKKILAVLIFFLVITMVNGHTEVFADEHNTTLNELNDRKIPQTFQFKYNYDELYNFLGVTEEDFQSKWESGNTITEIAKRQNISQQQLILYLAEKQFKALDKALEDGDIDRYFYYDYAISYMKGDIIEFINRNPNKKET